jgi:acyl carrier protein
MNISNDLEKFLINEIAVNLDKKSLTPDEDLLEKGIIDSLGIMKVILFMEENFRIAVTDDEIVPENFQNLNNMVKFVEQKLKSK